MITYAPTTTKRNARMLKTWRQQDQRHILRDLIATAKILGLISLGAVLVVVGLI